MCHRFTPPARSAPSAAIVTHRDPWRDAAGQPIAPSRAVVELQRALPKDARFIVDSGEHFVFATHYLKLCRPDQFIAMVGLGAMGSTIGLSIGCMLTDPRRATCVIIGDGGFTMVGLELLDSVARGLPVVVAIFNDHRLGMCELGHQKVYGRTPAFPVPALDVLSFAAAIGADGHLIRKAGEISALADRLRAPVRPQILDIHVDPTESLPKRDRIGALRGTVAAPVAGR
jgi:acetolactate synthase-1/2/3 large subunit